MRTKYIIIIFVYGLRCIMIVLTLHEKKKKKPDYNTNLFSLYETLIFLSAFIFTICIPYKMG